MAALTAAAHAKRLCPGDSDSAPQRGVEALRLFSSSWMRPVNFAALVSPDHHTAERTEAVRAAMLLE